MSGTGSGVSNVGAWGLKSGTSGAMPFSQVIEFEYQGYNFRVWYPEVSFSTELGMVMSCKIDYEISDNKDDHVILLMGVSVPANAGDQPVLSFAQATIQFTDMSDSNIMTSPCGGNNIINDVYDQLSSQLTGTNIDSNSGGRAYLADVAKANMQAMLDCAVFTPK